MAVISADVSKYRAYSATALIAMALYSAPIYSAVFHANSNSADYAGYNPFVEHMLSTGSITRPNFLYPGILSLLYKICQPRSLEVLHLVVSLLFVGALGATILHILWQGVNGTTGRRCAFAATITLMIVGPASFPVDQHRYFGYLMPNVYHNANILICKPLAVGSFYLVAKMFDEGTLVLKAALTMSALIILSALAKPNYAIVLLPAVCVFSILKYYRDGRSAAGQVLGFIGAPILVILVWQYAFTYLLPGVDIKPAHLSIRWFASWRDYNYIPKFFLSAAFPISVAALFYNVRVTHTFWPLAWLLFILSLPVNYLLVEVGRESHMNFAWTGQIAVFILFLATLQHVLRIATNRPRILKEWRFYVVVIVLLLHIVGGTRWYVHESVASGVYW